MHARLVSLLFLKPRPSIGSRRAKSRVCSLIVRINSVYQCIKDSPSHLSLKKQSILWGCRTWPSSSSIWMIWTKAGSIWRTNDRRKSMLAWRPIQPPTQSASRSKDGTAIKILEWTRLLVEPQMRCAEHFALCDRPHPCRYSFSQVDERYRLPMLQLTEL